MQVASITRQIGFLCYHDHTVGLVHSSGYSLFVKWSKCAQIYHFDRAAIAMNTIGSGRAGLQHHRAPSNDSEADWPIADEHTSSFTYGQRVITLWDVPIFCHGRNNVALSSFWRLGTIEAPPFHETTDSLSASSS